MCFITFTFRFTLTVNPVSGRIRILGCSHP